MCQLHAAGAKKVFREVANGAETDRPQLRWLLAEIEPGDVVSSLRISAARRFAAAIGAKRSATSPVATMSPPSAISQLTA